ncbi:hypothetical protein, partial [Streptomyces sp. RP5T]|uniref:hypothetical protein n=2 Tax=Streptomyces TaxID=1883 RepID=UPI001639FA61
QAPYGVPQPPPPGGGSGKTIGIVLGAVAVVAAIAVGAWLVLGNGGGSGGSDIADDGAHTLSTPATVLTDYKKSGSAEGDGFSEDDVRDAEKHGVKNAKDVSATYQSGEATDYLNMKMINFMGVYGDIDDPEKVVDAMFKEMQKSAATDSDGEAVGSPKAYTPAGLDGAVLKCQETKVSDSSGSGPSSISMPVCIWGDHSTLGVVIPIDMADAMAGKAADLSGAADMTAKLRKEVRVKA